MEWLNKLLDTDTQLFLNLNSFHNDFWDTAMFFFTRKETWFPLFIALIFYFIKNYRNKSFFMLLFFVLAIVASDQISVLIKESVQRLRPVHEPLIQDLVHNYYRKGGLYGFLSSHATNAFTVLTFSSYIFKNKNYTRIILLWALLFSYTRIYLGVHYPLDILGGMILGYIIGFIFYKLMMFVEYHFFITRQPIIKSTKLSSGNLGIIFLIFVLTLTIILIATRNLYQHHIL